MPWEWRGWWQANICLSLKPDRQPKLPAQGSARWLYAAWASSTFGTMASPIKTRRGFIASGTFRTSSMCSKAVLETSLR